MYSVRSLSMDRCCRSCSMYVPLVLVMLYSYHAVLLPLKSPLMIGSGICVIRCSGGRYEVGTDPSGGM